MLKEKENAFKRKIKILENTQKGFWAELDRNVDIAEYQEKKIKKLKGEVKKLKKANADLRIALKMYEKDCPK